jgi:hypothetical protein
VATLSKMRWRAGILMLWKKTSPKFKPMPLIWQITPFIMCSRRDHSATTRPSSAALFGHHWRAYLPSRCLFILSRRFPHFAPRPFWESPGSARRAGLGEARGSMDLCKHKLGPTGLYSFAYVAIRGRNFGFEPVSGQAYALEGQCRP